MSTFQGKVVKSNRIIYTPSTFAKTNLIHLQEAGISKATKPHISKRKNLSSYLCFAVVNGSGTLEYNGRTYPLAKGDCVFIDCNKPYAQYTSEHLWTIKWAHFYGPNMNAIYEKYMERGGRPTFTPDNFTYYVNLLDTLYAIATSDDYIRDMQIYEKLTSLLTLLMQESWNPMQNPATATRKRDLQDIKEYLDAHLTEKISLDDLAARFYINKFYLTRIFKEQFGMSITSYLLQIRITHAKQLLRFSDLPIEKIASECGMSDANYFARMFRKVEGMAPGEFRKKW